jgi:hypothetical protein
LTLRRDQPLLKGRGAHSVRPWRPYDELPVQLFPFNRALKITRRTDCQEEQLAGTASKPAGSSTKKKAPKR